MMGGVTLKCVQCNAIAFSRVDKLRKPSMNFPIANMHIIMNENPKRSKLLFNKGSQDLNLFANNNNTSLTVDS